MLALPNSVASLRAFTLLPVLSSLMLLLPTAAQAQESKEPPAASFTAVDHPKGYFDITLKPGQSQTVTVLATNSNTVSSSLATYVSDAYSAVNGGFGSITRNAGTEEIKKWLSNSDSDYRATTWLTYTSEVFDLAPSQSMQRTLTVTVPENTKPGQYLSSVVLENAEPMGAVDNGLKQVIRRIIPVSVTVPGALSPAFSFGAASHSLHGDKSTVSVEVLNTSNANIKPAGTMVIKDSDGNVVSEPKVEMRSVYSGTKTTTPAALASTLKPGKYTADIDLTDGNSDTSSKATGIPFTVESGTKDITQAEDPGAAVIQSASEGGWALYTGIGFLAVLTLLCFLVWKKRKNRVAVQEKDTAEPTDDRYFV